MQHIVKNYDPISSPLAGYSGKSKDFIILSHRPESTNLSREHPVIDCRTGGPIYHVYPTSYNLDSGNQSNNVCLSKRGQAFDMFELLHELQDLYQTNII